MIIGSINLKFDGASGIKPAFFDAFNIIAMISPDTKPPINPS